MLGAVKRQNAPADRIHLHGGVDVSGKLIETWRGNAATSEPLSELPEPLATGGFDVVASTCLLSQLVRSAVSELGEHHPRVGELALALRDRHLEVLVGLTRPGGRAILVADIVSSDTCPELFSASAEELPALERRLVLSHNFFTGVNPFAIQHAFAHHPRLAPRIAAQRVEGRWVWRVRGRAFFVVALGVERR
jgi:hypothetical protein